MEDMNNGIKIFSTFSGIGGFEIGIQNAWRSYVQTLRGWQKITEGIDEEWKRLHTLPSERTLFENRWLDEYVDISSHERQPHCVGYSEIDKYAIKVYEEQFPGVKNYGDITKINEKELPDFDCLIGGFPCQAFSIAGKRRGFEDTRGTLFFDLARILREKQPRYFVFENVKGLLSHDNGNTFRTIIATTDELGYDCQWQVLNSKDFGVPQNRERVYIVGHLRGTPRPEVFPIESNNGETSNEVSAKGQLVDLTRREPTSYRERTDGRVGTLDANYYKGLANQERPGVVQLNQSEVSYYGTPVDFTERRVRRLTPIECERLQGFPDNWTAQGTDGAISDTQRYKMCGNAVTTNVVQAVFEKIFASGI